jgi:hypothetical protein
MAQQQTQNDGWNVVSTAPIPKATQPGDGWNVVSTAPTQSPIIDMSAPVAGMNGSGIPGGVAPQPANFSKSPAATSVMKPSWVREDADATPGTASQKLFGDIPVSNTGIVAGQHLKQLATGPIHALTDAPTSPIESALQAAAPSGTLPLYRALVKPSIDNASDSIDAFKSGDYAQAAQRALEAVPIAGPEARGYLSDAKTYGVVPALAGLATDFLAPEAAGKILAPVVKGAGSVARFASADDASRNLAATRLLTKGTPGQLLQSALKPAASYGADAADMLQAGLPNVINAAESDPKLQGVSNSLGVSGFAKASTLAREAAAQPYTDLVAPYGRSPFQGSSGASPKPSAIDGNPIANAQMFSMPFMDQVEKPYEVVKPEYLNNPNVFTSSGASAVKNNPAQSLFMQTKKIADNYRMPFNVPELDSIRQDSNAKLDAFYNKSGGDRVAALSNPETSRVKAVGDSTREQLYPFLEKDNGLAPGDVAKMQDDFARMSNIENIANKREPIYARQDPIGLAAKTGLGMGDALNPLGALGKTANFFLQKKVADLTNSDALVNSAIDRSKNPSGTPMVPRPGSLRTWTPFASGQPAPGTFTLPTTGAVMSGVVPKLGVALGNAADHLTPPVVRTAARLASAANASANNKKK